MGSGGIFLDSVGFSGIHGPSGISGSYTRGRDQLDEALSRKSGVGVLFC